MTVIDSLKLLMMLMFVESINDQWEHSSGFYITNLKALRLHVWSSILIQLYIIKLLAAP